MQKSIRLMATVLFLGAYLLSACTGAAPRSGSPEKAQKVSASEVVFTGTVESMNGNQWVVDGQQVTVDASTALDANIKVGDAVKVEAKVSQDGSVQAVKIESSVPDDANANSNNANDANANNNANVNDNSNGNVNDNSNGNGNGNGNGNDSAGGQQNEVTGVVEAITSDTITIDGVMYNLANSTEFKDGIVVGDQVKLHVIINADGTFTVREIEKSTDIGNNDNSNSNSNGDDQVGNSNSNSNGDDQVGNSNSNSNGDKHGGGSSDNSGGGDDHGGDSNGSDD